MMANHHYRITQEQLDATSSTTPSPSLQFDFDNHDDIFAIIERLDYLQQRGDISAAEVPQLAVGLKLFGKVMMENRESALFAALHPHFVEFMRELKKGVPKN
jgi:hypothetical protein